jgi:glutamate-5-semialdehyde dehydrogenase
MTDPIRAQAQAARKATRALARADDACRRDFLHALAATLRADAAAIVRANEADLTRGRAAGLGGALLDRLLLDPPRIEAMARDVEHIATLPDPLAATFDSRVLGNGLKIHRRRVPIGVLAVIYESRPNVTVDVAALAIRSGNAVLLRGGKEAIDSNRALAAIVRSALGSSGLPEDAVQFVDAVDRESTRILLAQHDLVDLVVPRGGAGLHAFCRQESRIPVITGGIGICHLYVDAAADLERALPVIRNAKVQRPTVCNALDTLLVHESVAAEFLPAVFRTLAADGVRFRCDPAALGLAQGLPDVDAAAAGLEDFDTEWLSLVLGVRVVARAEEAMTHIEAHSSGHSDGILTADEALARHFLERIDSAAVYWNASTRFTDGGQLGLGAEIAVSTQRLHARGPMGLEGITSYKWVIEGDYQVRA